MVHELIGIRNGRVDLSNVPGIKPELKVFILRRILTSGVYTHTLTVFLKRQLNTDFLLLSLGNRPVVRPGCLL